MLQTLVLFFYYVWNISIFIYRFSSHINMRRYRIFYIYDFDYCLNYAQKRKHAENIYANQEDKLTMYVYVYKKVWLQGHISSEYY